MIFKGSLEGKIIKCPIKGIDNVVKGFPTFGIVGGEFAIVEDKYGVALQTLLGSCVAVMFYDVRLKIKAINHFFLPQGNSKDESYRFGLYSIEGMLNSMYKLGVKKGDLIAKIAGGAKVLEGDLSDVGLKNVKFAREFCEVEKINVVSESVLGNNGRVVLLTENFETYIRYIDNRNVNEQIKEEDKKLQNVIAKSKTQNITLF